MSGSHHLTLFVFLLVASQLVLCTEYYVKIANNGPVVLGANVTFTAEVYDEYGRKPSGPFRFYWMDNAIPQQHSTFEGDLPTSQWTVNYPSSLYNPGQYEVEVNVQRWSVITWWSLTSGRLNFNITMLLNGNMDIVQNNASVSSEYISTSYAVKHNIKLSQSDYNYLAKNATSVLTYWFVDCVYFGSTTNYTFTNRYNASDEVHNIEALVVASYEPIPPPTTPPPPTTSTTTKPTTTTATPKTTTPKPATTTEKPTAALLGTSLEPNKSSIVGSTEAVAPEKAAVVKRNTNIEKIARSIKKTDKSNGFLNLINGSLQIPFACLNQTVVPIDPKKTYGYFQRKIITQDPVSNVSIKGNNWLQHEDMLMLQVKCRGSPPYEYCLQFRQGLYNVTGNETCRDPLSTQTCDFPVVHYFSNVDIHTVVIIVYNSVHKVVSPVTVRFYQVVTKAQLSVIVVPVSFSILAAILIVFGVAYYIQHRSRFTVEVADFNFGQQYADLEYKTFGERLRESFNNALNWGGTREADREAPSPPWPVSDNNKYGTMT